MIAALGDQRHRIAGGAGEWRGPRTGTDHSAVAGDLALGRRNGDQAAAFAPEVGRRGFHIPRAPAPGEVRQRSAIGPWIDDLRALFQQCAKSIFRTEMRFECTQLLFVDGPEGDAEAAAERPFASFR